jgi:DNA replication and repair protein RecF
MNILAGGNAQGKTNILEAILFIAISRSERTSRDADLVRWEESLARVRGEVERRVRERVSVDVILERTGRKTIKVNNLAKSRLAEVIGQVNVVMFSPQDREIVSGEPATRRRFLNLAIAQTSPEYYYNLACYRKVLAQRNRLLRSFPGQASDQALLEAWDEQLLTYGTRLIATRERVVEQLATRAAETHGKLAGGRERLAVQYRSNVHLKEARDEAEVQAAYAAELARRRTEEIRRGVTLVGPHRDDLRLLVDGVEARVYGSQGQQRTAALALKLAELDLVREWIGESPILLLDDVMSELDDSRREQVMALTDDVEQILITCSQQRTFSEAILRRSGLFHVHDGQVDPVEV